MKKTILIVFVILIVLGLSGFFVFHKFSNFSNNVNKSEDKVNSKTDYIITDVEKLSDYDNENLEEEHSSNSKTEEVKENNNVKNNSKKEEQKTTSKEVKNNSSSNNQTSNNNVQSKNDNQTTTKEEETPVQNPTVPTNDKVEEKTKEDLTKVVDTENFFYSIHKGKVEFNKMDSCVNAGMDIAYLDVVDINYYRCYEVLSKAGTTMGYYLNIFCNSGNCDRYKSQVDLKSY